MKLADDITVIIEGEAITLRPSLAYAIRLERRPGSFQKLIRDVLDGSLTAACDIIRDHAPHPWLETRVLDVLDDLSAPLLEYISACMGIDPDAPKTKGKATTVTFAEHLTDLYRIGTGWLGWTPADTLDATPAEIMEAYRGRMDMLKAIFGGSESRKTDTRPFTDANVVSAFRTTFGAVREGM